MRPTPMIEKLPAPKCPEPSDRGGQPAVRRGTLLLISLVALTCVGLIWLNSHHRREKTESAGATASTSPTDDGSSARMSSASQSFREDGQLQMSDKPRKLSQPAGPTTASLRQPATNATPAAWSGAQPTAAARELVARLLQFDGTPKDLTPARAAEWTRDLQQLAQQGEGGVAAIRELLGTGTDRDFGDWGRTNLGFATADRKSTRLNSSHRT